MKVTKVTTDDELPGRREDDEVDERIRASLADGTFRQVNSGGVCICAECGREFAGLAYFDAHRPSARTDLPCLDPSYAGLIQDAAGRWFDPVKREARVASIPSRRVAPYRPARRAS